MPTINISFSRVV